MIVLLHNHRKPFFKKNNNHPSKNNSKHCSVGYHSNGNRNLVLVDLFFRDVENLTSIRKIICLFIYFYTHAYSIRTRTDSASHKSHFE